MFNPKMLAGLLVFAAMAAPVQAAPATTFLNNSIISKIPKQDRASFRAAVGQALNDSADGQTTTWTSTSNKRRAPVEVALTPKQTTQTQKADRCRLLDARFAQSGGKEDWSFWFCRQADGSWKASSH